MPDQRFLKRSIYPSIKTSPYPKSPLFSKQQAQFTKQKVSKVFTKASEYPVYLNKLLGAPATCLFFGSYETFKVYLGRQYKDQPEMRNNYLAGVLAECFSCLLWLPIDIIKERQQAEPIVKVYHYRNFLEAFRQIKIREGVMGFYRGYWSTILAYAPMMGFTLMVYEKLKQIFRKDYQLAVGSSFYLGFTSGALASMITYPLDLIKAGVQVRRAEMSLTAQKSIHESLGYGHVLSVISANVRREGIMSLWKGSSSRMLHIALASGVNLSLLDFFRTSILENRK